ncbi:toprim domain-containing protein [Elizabethkingia anophelis]|nr:toprim domain-containing protein [Elizabethkingia anophelis]MCT4194905.1 toprim domain-containing protein [Elizabethkingia anophelis]
MNCKQFNNIPLEEVLLSLGHLPTKHNEKETWFLNPFGTETQASFKLDKKQNVWFLHSEGIGGNNTDFMKKYLNASVKEVLEWAEKRNFSFFHLQTKIPESGSNIKPNKNYQITEIKDLQNENLIRYLQQRGLSSNVFPLVKEVHFKMCDKNQNLYAIGFENNSGGWELRNQFYKGAILKKDVSIIHLNQDSDDLAKNQNVVVFEGFMDMLSFVEMKRFFKGDVLVMNSIALLNKAKEHLKNYSEIHLFLDNDQAGKICKNEILKSFPNANDCSEMYSEHKDLNEFLIEQIQKESEILGQNEQQQNVQGFRRRR